jgi:hypothetical protein
MIALMMSKVMKNSGEMWQGLVRTSAVLVAQPPLRSNARLWLAHRTQWRSS